MSSTGSAKILLGFFSAFLLQILISLFNEWRTKVKDKQKSRIEVEAFSCDVYVLLTPFKERKSEDIKLAYNERWKLISDTCKKTQVEKLQKIDSLFWYLMSIRFKEIEEFESKRSELKSIKAL